MFPGLEVRSLVLVVVRVDAEAAADEHVEAGQRLGAVGDRRQAEHVAGDVLVVVTADVVRIGTGGRGMGHRHARHGPHGPALLLERDGDRLEQRTGGIDVDRVVVGLAAVHSDVADAAESVTAWGRSRSRPIR